MLNLTSSSLRRPNITTERNKIEKHYLLIFNHQVPDIWKEWIEPRYINKIIFLINEEHKQIKKTFLSNKCKTLSFLSTHNRYFLSATWLAFCFQIYLRNYTQTKSDNKVATRLRHVRRWGMLSSDVINLCFLNIFGRKH